MLSNFGLRKKLFILLIIPVVLISSVIFIVMLPSIRRALYEEKREQLKALGDSVLSIVQYYHSLEASGVISRQEAQERAFGAVRAIRFGERGLDYFWINDMSCVMLMHPMVPALEGTSMYDTRDVNGFPFMREMVDVVNRHGSGFVEYHWQYYDDAARIEPKESYVAGFGPWEWVIGTGIYVHNVDRIVGSQRDSILFFMSITLILSLSIGYFFVEDIIGSVRKVINNLVRNSEMLSSASAQVSSASSEVSTSSQSMAEGASEQASSIEETSASIEEMSSMAKQNAENANLAKSLMLDAKAVVGEANDAMQKMTVSMKEIAKASDDTSKIIKTIDEIAFQTNLLALNAAVEAARAGEAGAGFAVVADEVRNLAMRAAEAAKNTAKLIEATVKKVHGGQNLVEETNSIFSKVAESASKVGELIAEISAASSEQNAGVDQINKAIVELEKVTQQNASNSEETASASEELSGQASELKKQSLILKSVINELRSIIWGAGNSKTNYTEDHEETEEDMPVQTKQSYVPKVKTMAVQKHRKAIPSEVIPFDEDFGDF